VHPHGSHARVVEAAAELRVPLRQRRISRLEPGGGLLDGGELPACGAVAKAGCPCAWRALGSALAVVFGGFGEQAISTANAPVARARRP
jgi:hypothetical protein